MNKLTTRGTRSVVQVRNVTVNLGQKTVLEKINFDIEAGELVGLIGPNGAGKTTLMRAILSLVNLQKGTVTVEGKRPGYVPQRQDVHWEYPISIEEMVLMGSMHGMFRRTTRQKYRDVRAALEAVDMLKLACRPIGHLSGGQRQRVLIARALMDNPSILLLDEPFTGLDQPTQDILSVLFRQLADKGTAVLMSTHDLSQAVDTCDRLILLDRTIRGMGHPQELRDPSLWMETYSVREDSPLLRSIGLLAGGVS